MIDAFEARPYQSRAISAVRRLASQGVKRVCLVLPTGGGKTYTAGMLIASALAKGTPALFLCHRVELIQQAADSFRALGMSPSVICDAADGSYDAASLLQVASIETLFARGDRPRAGLIIPDECHHVLATTWRAVTDSYPSAFVLGLTATPQRGDGSPLGDVFERIVVGATYSELLADGKLVDCEVIAAPHAQKKLAFTPAEAYQRFARGKRAVIFCATVAEATEAAQNIPGAMPAHGGMNKAERKEALQAHVISSCALLTEGWNDPSREVGILARSCGHAGLFVQIAGRLLRPAPGKSKALLIDLCGAVHHHGHPLEDREYSLSGQAIKRAAGARSLWQCKACGWIAVTPPPNRICGNCDTPLPPPKALAVQANGRLIAVHWTCRECGHQRGATPLSCPMCGAETQRGARVASDTPEQRRAYYESMLAIERARGYKRGWAAFRFKGKYGEMPR